MKANQLRIGNIAKSSVTGALITVTALHIHDLDNGYIKLEGVAITEEWLLKFGFEKYNDCFYRFIMKRGYSDGWFISKENELTKSISEFMIRVKHVHDLQNLYHSLTNQELQIKP
jgi:hypothetical protein